MVHQPLLDSLRHQRDTLVNEVDALLESEDFDPQDQNYLDRKNRASNLSKKIEEVVEHEKRKLSGSEIDRLGIQLAEGAKQRREAETQSGTVGEIFIRSSEFAEYQRVGRGTSYKVETPLQTRATWTTTTPPGSAFIPANDQIVAASAGTLTPLYNSVGKIQVATNSVDVITFGLIDGVATVAEGALKPEATGSMATAPATLETLAGWVAVTRQLLADGTAIRDWIDTELRRALLRKIEDQIGTALVGGTYVDVPASGTLINDIRTAVGVLQSNGWNPTSVVLHPSDFASLDITVWGNPGGGNVGAPAVGSQFWGLQAIPSNKVTAGEAYVSDLPTAIKWLNRGTIETFVSDSATADSFLKNIIHILQEVRGVAVVTQPNAVAKIAAAAPLTAGAGTSKGGGNGR